MSSPFWGEAAAQAGNGEDPVIAQLRRMGYVQTGAVWSHPVKNVPRLNGHQIDQCPDCGTDKKKTASVCRWCYDLKRRTE